MPALQHFTVLCKPINTMGFPGCTTRILSIENSILSFISIHDQNLHQLHIGVLDLCIHATRFQQILHHCPLLERLIIHPSSLQSIHWTDRPFHPKLRWIDFIHHLRDKRHFQDSSLCLSDDEFPSLQGLRRFCDLPRHLEHWLDEFQPTEQDGSDNFILRVWHQELVYQGGLVLWKDS